MTPLQQKRHRELEATLTRAHEQRDEAIRRLVRCDGRLQMLLRTKARLEKAMAKLVPSTVPVSVTEGKLLDAVEAKPVAALPSDDVTDIPFSELPIADRLDIPTFLQRSKEADAKDAAAATAIKAEQAERKKLKANIRKEERAAKASGATKRMPLTGREALQYLKTGSRA